MPIDRWMDKEIVVHIHNGLFSSVQFSSVAQSCLTLCNAMNRSTPGLPVHHQLLEFTQTHIHQVSDAIQPSHPLSSPFPPALNPAQHQSLFQWANSHLAIKRNSFESVLLRWMNLEPIIQSEVRQKEKDIHIHSNTYMRNLGCHLWGRTELDMTEAT